MSLNLCIISHESYGALTGTPGPIGGVEWQTSLMARWLAGRGHRVTLLTWDHGQGDGQEVDNVRVLTICRPEAGLPGVRFFHPRWTGLSAAMDRADADVYYQNGAECVTGQAAMWCRRHGRKLVFSAASNRDCRPHSPELSGRRERTLHHYGIRRADHIIVQTRNQQTMLRESFGRDSTVIPMPCPGPSAAAYEAISRRQRDPRRVLWVGRLQEVKRPDRLLDVAQACPDLVFDVVGPAFADRYCRMVCRRAERMPNVFVHGAVSREELPKFYSRASVMCSTSDSEGFPNAFLEAWSYGLPIVATLDPDGLIAERGLGAIPAGGDRIAESIYSILDSPHKWSIASANCRRYYEENHTVEAVMPRFEQVFLDMSRLAPTLVSQ